MRDPFYFFYQRAMKLVDARRKDGLDDDAVYDAVFEALHLEYPMADDTRLDTAVRFYMEQRTT